MGFIVGSFNALGNIIVLLLSFVYKLLLDIISVPIHIITFLFGTLRKVFVFIVPLIYLFGVFVYGTSPFTFNNVIAHSKEVAEQLRVNGLYYRTFGIAILCALLFWFSAKMLYKIMDEADVTLMYWSYCASNFCKKRFKAIKKGFRQVKYGIGTSADYAMIKDFKTTLNYYGNILKREGKSDEYIASYIRPTYYETVYDKGIDISDFVTPKYNDENAI